MRGGILIFGVAICLAGTAQAKPLPNSYGYGRTATSSGPVIDLRGLLPAAPDAPFTAPAKTPQKFADSTASGDALAARCYPDDRAGGQTASGETYSSSALSASHPDMPLSSLALIKDQKSGKEVIVRVNDRPTVGATIEISPAVAEALGSSCQASISVRRLGPAPFVAPAGKSPRPAAQAPEAMAVAAAASEPAREAFLVQIGAFSMPENAEAARVRAATAGPVSVEPATIGGVAIYRVRLGPWASREEAEQARLAAEALGFAGAKLITP